MKRLLLLFSIIVLGPMSVHAIGFANIDNHTGLDEAFKKERRIFLWDVTISMVGATKDASCPKGDKRSKPDFDYSKSGFPYYNEEKDIYDETRDVLIDKIMQIQNESTEIIVLPFRNGIVGEFKANATASGKEFLKEQIMSWNDLVPGGTYTATCLEEAVNKYFTKDRTNRIFLLTDGEPSDGEGPKLLNYIMNWKGLSETKGSGIYLVYVMLTDEADNADIKKVAELNPEQIQVIEADQDFEEHVTIVITNNVSLYVRDCFKDDLNSAKGVIHVPYSFIEGVEIPENSHFYFKIEENDYVEINDALEIFPENGSFAIPFSLKKSFEENLAELSHEYDTVLTITCIKDQESRNIDISGKNTILLSLIMKPEPRVTIKWMEK